MGIEGLTLFITKFNQDCLVHHQLSNTFLIVDGGISNCIYDELDQDVRFGGDYRQMYDATFLYFKNLLRCNVTPIVILDGISENKRSCNTDRKKYRDLIKYNNNGYKCEGNYFPLFKTEAFIEALKDLGVIYCRSDFEADQEIMELARKKKYPVLSSDSDFYISDGVTFIPWLDAKDGLKKWDFPYVSCKRFDREDFVKKWKISLCALPLLAVIMKSSYSKNKGKPLVNIICPNIKKSSLEDKIKYTVIFLRDETLESAKSKIIYKYCRQDKSCTPAEFEDQINSTVEKYTAGKCTIASTLERYDILKKEFENVKLNIREDMINTHNVPVDLMNMVRECKLRSTTLDMFTEKKYRTKILLEDLSQMSVHASFVSLIQSIYSILNYEDESIPPLTLFIRTKQIEDLPEYIRPKFSPESTKYETLHAIMGNNSIVQENVKFFDDGWLIFILALLYYHKYCKSKVYIHGILLSALILNANEIFRQENVANRNDCSKLKLSDYLIRLTKKDCKIVAEEITKQQIQKSDNKDKELTKFMVEKIHFYLTFQTCLFYTMELSTLLKLPEQIKISNFMSGSLFYFFASHLELEESCEKWIERWLDEKGSTNLKTLYFLILNKLNACELSV